jgi:hypothetical protein
LQQPASNAGLTKVAGLMRDRDGSVLLLVWGILLRPLTLEGALPKPDL